MTKEQEAHVALWVEALRSGKYTQAEGYLAVKGPDEKWEYCCLGVACSVAIKQGLPLAVSEEEEGIIMFDGKGGELPSVVRKWLGLKDPAGWHSTNALLRSLASLNDAGTPFEEIADIIEAKPEGLFV